MKILDRYILLEFVKSFLLSLAALVFMFEIMTVLEGFNIETKSDKIHLYRYYLFVIPQIISFVLPAALMFGVCFTVAQFTVAREMVAVHSAGISFYRSIKYLLFVGAFSVIFLFLFQNFIVTPLNSLALDEMSIVKKNTGRVKDIVWQKNLRGKQGYYFLYYFDQEKLRVVGGFNYLEVDEKSFPVKMYDATKAEYLKNSGEWKLMNVNLLYFDKDYKILKKEFHSEIIQKFPEELEFFSNPFKDPSKLDIFELQDEIKLRDRLGISSIPYRVQFHSNISFPLMSFIVVLVGSLAGGMGSLRSGGPLIRSLLLSTATILIYQIIYRLGLSFGNNGVLSPTIAGWGPTIIFFFAAGYLIRKHRK